jgi:hypothetical protein
MFDAEDIFGTLSSGDEMLPPEEKEDIKEVIFPKVDVALPKAVVIRKKNTALSKKSKSPFKSFKDFQGKIGDEYDVYDDFDVHHKLSKSITAPAKGTKINPTKSGKVEVSDEYVKKLREDIKSKPNHIDRKILDVKDKFSEDRVISVADADFETKDPTAHVKKLVQDRDVFVRQKLKKAIGKVKSVERSRIRDRDIMAERSKKILFREEVVTLPIEEISKIAIKKPEKKGLAPKTIEARERREKRKEVKLFREEVAKKKAAKKKIPVLNTETGFSLPDESDTSLYVNSIHAFMPWMERYLMRYLSPESCIIEGTFLDDGLNSLASLLRVDRETILRCVRMYVQVLCIRKVTAKCSPLVAIPIIEMFMSYNYMWSENYWDPSTRPARWVSFTVVATGLYYLFKRTNGTPADIITEPVDATYDVESGFNPFSSLRDFLGNILCSPAIETFKQAVSLILSLHIAPDIFADFAKKYMGLKPIKATVFELVEQTVSILATVWDYAALALQGDFAWCRGVHDINTLIANAELHIKKTALITVGIPSEGDISESDWFREANKYIDRLTFVTKNWGLSSMMSVRAKTVLLNLRVAYNFQLDTHAENRVTPAVVVIVGTPGIGKSSIQNLACKFQSEVMGREFTPDMVYTRVNNSEFWDGYKRGQPIVRYGDVGTLQPSITKNRGDALLDEILVVASSESLLLNYSGTTPDAPKGKGHFRAEMILIDTNDEKMGIENVRTNAAAVRRRMIFTSATVKPEFRLPNSTQLDAAKALAAGDYDYHYYDVYTYLAIDSVRSERKDYLRKGNVHEFHDTLTHLLRTHYERESMKKTADDNLKNMTFGVQESEVEDTYDQAFKSMLNGDVDETESKSPVIRDPHDDEDYNLSHFMGEDGMDKGSLGIIENYAKALGYNVYFTIFTLLMGYISLWCVRIYDVMWNTGYYIHWLVMHIIIVYVSEDVQKSICKWNYRVMAFSCVYRALAHYYPMPDFSTWTLLISCFISWYFTLIEGFKRANTQYVSTLSFVSHCVSSARLKMMRSYDSFRTLWRPIYRNDHVEVPANMVWLSRCKSALALFSVLGAFYGIIRIMRKETVDSEIGSLNDLDGAGNVLIRKKKENTWETLEKPLVMTTFKTNNTHLYYKVMKNVREVRFPNMMKTHLIGVGKSFALINTHALSNGNIFDMVKREGDTPIRCDISERRIDLGNDVSLIQLPITFADILSFMLPDITVLPKTAKGFIGADPISLSAARKATYLRNKDEMITCDHGYHYKWKEHAPGKCGSPLTVTLNGSEALIGMHAGGSGLDSAFSVPFTRDVVEKGIFSLTKSSPLMVQCSNGENVPGGVPPNTRSPFLYETFTVGTYFGGDGNPVSIPKKSKLKKSLIADSLPTLFDKHFKFHPTTFYGPPVMEPRMRRGVWKSPYNTAVRKLERKKFPIDGKILRKVVDELVDRISSQLPALQPWTFEQAINGESNDAFCRRVDVTKAAGYGFEGKKSKYLPEANDDDIGIRYGESAFRKMIRTMTPELRESILKQVNEYLAGRKVHPISKAHPKDEPREISKIESASTRIFYMAPLDNYILARKYLGPFYSSMVANGLAFSAGLGIDRHRDGEIYYNYLHEFSDLIMEGDFSSYDMSIPLDVRLAGATVVYRVLERLGYNERDLEIVRGLLSDSIDSFIAMLGEIVNVPGLQTSGRYGTAEDNTLCVTILYMIFYYYYFPDGSFFDDCRPLIYGDDSLCAVKERVSHLINNKNFAIFCKTYYNMDYTSAAKSANMQEFLSIDEVSFLKSSFTMHHKHGRVMPLCLDSVYKALAWTLPSDNISEEDQLFATVTSMLREMYLHTTSFHEYNVLRDHFAYILSKATGITEEFYLTELPTADGICTSLSSNDVETPLYEVEESSRSL